MKHPINDRSQKLSKMIKKQDHITTKKDKELDAESHLAEVPKFRANPNPSKPSNKKLDSEKHLSNKMKNLKTFENFEVNEKLTDEEKEERLKAKEADKKAEDSAKDKKREEILSKYKKQLKEKGYRGFDENLNINEWYGTSADEDSATIRVEGDGQNADYILEKIEGIINHSQGKFNLYHNDVKII